MRAAGKAKGSQDEQAGLKDVCRPVPAGCLRGSMSLPRPVRTMTPYINTDYFDFRYPDTSRGHRIMDAQYWSSNKYVGTTMRGDRSAFGFNFADGRINAYPTGQGRGPTKRSFIRCVRGKQGYGVNHFTDNGDVTITDAATGLMWTKSDSAVTGNWEQALSYAEKLVHAGIWAEWALLICGSRIRIA